MSGPVISGPTVPRPTLRRATGSSDATTPPTWTERVQARLEGVAASGRWREPRAFDARGPSGVLDGAPVVSFASNDYLGLSAHPAVVAAATAALERWGAGAGASRLITGSRPVHVELEHALAEWKGTAASICFPTGFAANLAALGVLGGPDVRVLSDELNHASIIDGCRLSRSQLTVYPHCDLRRLSELLAEPTGGPIPTIVVTDTVFSMDGDVAPVEQIAALCRRHGALLLLDEAHAVLGPHLPPGLTADPDLTLVRMGTLSKTLGSLGGFLAGSREVVDLMVNLARPYIFTTALTPADAAAALAALAVLRSPEGDALVQRLADLVARVARWAGADPGAAGGPASPIIPVVLGSEQRALRGSAALLAAGIWVPAIRPPTVPVGTSRLRLTLSAAHTDEQVARLLDALARLRAAVPARVP
ncbi:MAG: aminotransferase class I/II-fold pyridoxal phosphate-dependent enzyme [Acidimicrobiales bacterium]